MPILWYGWTRKLNKIMLYVGLAILLGTVTMVVPLALLGPSDHITDDKYLVTVPEPAPSEQERATENGKPLESFDTQGAVPAAPTEPEPAATPEPTEPPIQEPGTYELTFGEKETSSDLSPIGLMTVPSFIIALGVFVYLRKRM
jgi:hypothetical protein